jgi:hypothetical protein
MGSRPNMGETRKSPMQLLHASHKGKVLRGSVPIIPKQTLPDHEFSENIKSGDILQVRLLIKFNTARADEVR